MAFFVCPDQTMLVRAQAHRLAFNLETLQVTVDGFRPGVVMAQLLDQIYALEQVCTQLQAQLNHYRPGELAPSSQERQAKRPRVQDSEPTVFPDGHDQKTVCWSSEDIITSNCTSFVFPCGYCHRTFTTKGAHSRHQKGHLQKGDLPIGAVPTPSAGSSSHEPEFNISHSRSI